MTTAITTYRRRRHPLVTIGYSTLMPENLTVQINGRLVGMDSWFYSEISSKMQHNKPDEARAAVLRRYRKYLRSPAMVTYCYHTRGGRDLIALQGNTAPQDDIQAKLQAFKVMKAAYPEMVRKFGITSFTAELGPNYQIGQAQEKCEAELDPKPKVAQIQPPQFFCTPAEALMWRWK